MIPTSKDTALPQIPRILRLVEDDLGWEPLSRNVDIGGGPYDFFTQALAELAVENLVYDPHNRAEEHNREVLRKLHEQLADSATICDVLNVLSDRRDMLDVLRKAKRWVKKGGNIYITVYQGDKSEKSEMDANCYQANRPIWAYVNLVRQIFPDSHQRCGYILAVNH